MIAMDLQSVQYASVLYQVHLLHSLLPYKLGGNYMYKYTLWLINNIENNFSSSQFL